MPCTSLESGSVTLTLPWGASGGANGLGGPPKRRPSLITPRAILLVAVVGGALDRKLLLQPALGLRQALRARARNRPRLVGALLLQPLGRSAEPPASALRGRQDLRQLIATTLTVRGGLGRVG